MRKFLFLFISVFSFFCSVSQTTNSVNGFAFNWKNSISRQSDQNFFVGGVHQNIFSPFATKQISVVNSNLTQNSSLNTSNGWFSNYLGVNDEVFDVEAIKGTENKRYVGGSMYYFKGVYVNGFMRILSNGDLDPSFTLNNNTSANALVKVRCVHLQGDNKVVLGGMFSQYLGVPRGRIVRLNPNGTVDNTFTTNGTGFNGEVYCIKQQVDGKYIVGGNFTSYNGIERNRIARLNNDGSLDATFAQNSGVDGLVRTVLIESSGKIMIGGDFGKWIAGSGIAAKSLRAERILRLKADGYHNGPMPGFYKPFTINGVTTNIAKVYTISSYLNNKIFIGGNFDTYNNISRSNVCLLNQDVSLSSDFNTSFMDGAVHDSLLEGNNVIIVGNFWIYNGVNKNGIMKISPAGVALRPTSNDIIEEVNEGSFVKSREFISNIKKVNIFPNPANDIININSNVSEIKSIDIFTIEGRKVYSNLIIEKENSFEINIQDLSKGIFIVSIEFLNGEIETQRFVKN